MKKYILCLLTAVIAGISNQVSGQLKVPPPINPTIVDIWKTLPSIDTARHSAATFVIGSKIYVIMGDTSSQFFRGHLVAATWELDTNVGTWTRKAPFPGRIRTGAVGFSIGTKGYIGGGRLFDSRDTMGKSKFRLGKNEVVAPFPNKVWSRTDTMYTYTNAKGDSVVNDFWEYDQSTDKWTKKADIPGTIMGRAYPIGFAMKGKGYIGLGYDNGRIKGTLGTATATVIGPYIDSIVFNGSSVDTVFHRTINLEIDSVYSDSILYKKDLWEYDPTGNSWTAKANFPGLGRAYSTAMPMRDSAAIGLGKGDSTTLIKDVFFDDFYTFNPVSNKWKRMADFPASKRYGAGGWGIGFLGYIINGNDGLDRKDFYEYNAISNTWDRLPNKPDSARSLAVGGMVGLVGYYGTGAGVKKSYKNMFKWLVDTNRISILNTLTGPYCGGQKIQVVYKAPKGVTFGSGNKFFVQVSDTAGSFFYPVDATDTTSQKDSGSFYFTIPPTTLASKTYRFRVVSTNPKMTGTPTLVDAEIKQLPSAVSGPYNQASCLTADAKFIVQAAGTNITYQWRKGGAPISDGAKYSGTTTDTLTVLNSAAGDAGDYDVVISGTCSPAAISPKATLTVQNIPPPTVTTQPLTDTVCEGSSKTFGVAASGTSISYRWIKGKDTLRNGPFISNAYTNALNINPTRLRDSGWYRAVIIEACGSKTLSDSFYLGFHDNTAILLQPINVDTVEFVDIGFKVKAKGHNNQYQWYKGNTLLSNGTKYTGVDTDSVTIHNLTMGDVGFYRVEVTGDCGTTQKSLLGLLEIDPMPVITEQPANDSACEKSTVFFSVKVDGANITYQWRKNGTNLANGGKYSGADERTLVITGIDNTDIGDYDCEVSTGPYTKVTSNKAKLTVLPIPAKPVINSFGPQFIQSNVSGDKYRWYYENIYDSTLKGQTIPVNKVGDYRVRVYKDGCISELSDPYFWFPTFGIADVNAGSIKLYPNPANNKVEIEIPEGVSSGTIKVYDMLGKALLTRTFDTPGNLPLNIATLGEGMYFVTVTSGSDTYVGRLVKQ